MKMVATSLSLVKMIDNSEDERIASSRSSCALLGYTQSQYLYSLLNCNSAYQF